MEVKTFSIFNTSKLKGPRTWWTSIICVTLTWWMTPLETLKLNDFCVFSQKFLIFWNYNVSLMVH
jgi:hypothetical protein